LFTFMKKLVAHGNRNCTAKMWEWFFLNKNFCALF
jgi:hypothetical protein